MSNTNETTKKAIKLLRDSIRSAKPEYTNLTDQEIDDLSAKEFEAFSKKAAEWRDEIDRINDAFIKKYTKIS